MIAGLPDRALDRAQRLAATVHGDGGPAEVADLLTPLDTGELYALTVALAAMVDIDKTPHELLGWAEALLGKKHCYGCRQTLTVSSFASDRSQSDGLNKFCRACASARYRARAVNRRCDELGIRQTSPVRRVASVTELPRGRRRATRKRVVA